MSNPTRTNSTVTDAPFFTVLVPTMNRPHLLRTALQSVLWQTFTNFELIVSDNSNEEDSRTENLTAVKEHVDDPRLQYIRPDQWLNMPDHWEFATRRASGRYVVILTDRHLMRPSALEYLYAQISKLPHDLTLFAWHDYSSFLDASGTVVTRDFTGEAEVLDSKVIARDYARFQDWAFARIFSNLLPRMLNSCYRSDLAKTIREEHGRLFIPVSPDYTAAFLFLAYTDKMAYLDRPLMMFHGGESNGRKSLIHGIDAYASTLRDVDVFARTPVPLNTVFNSVVRDLLEVKTLVGERFAEVDIDFVGYYLSNYSEILFKERLGSPMNTGKLFDQWWNGVEELTLDQQKIIRDHVIELDRSRNLNLGLRRFAVRWGLTPLYHYVTGKLTNLRHRLAERPVYANALEAGRKTDHLLTDPVKTEGRP